MLPRALRGVRRERVSATRSEREEAVCALENIICGADEGRQWAVNECSQAHNTQLVHACAESEDELLLLMRTTRGRGRTAEPTPAKPKKGA